MYDIIDARCNYEDYEDNKTVSGCSQTQYILFYFYLEETGQDTHKITYMLYTCYENC